MGEIMVSGDTNLLARKIEELIEASRKRVVEQVNSVMVHTYYEIGRIMYEYGSYRSSVRVTGNRDSDRCGDIQQCEDRRNPGGVIYGGTD